MKQAWRITERINLLKLRPEYRKPLAAKQITPSQATEMTRLSVHGQDVLFRAIKSGSCKSYEALRNAANALVEAEASPEMFNEDEAPQATEQDVRDASRFERKIEQVAQLLRDGIRDNEVIAVKKVNPTKADTLADPMAAMRKDLSTIETALRRAAIQAELAA